MFEPCAYYYIKLYIHIIYTALRTIFFFFSVENKQASLVTKGSSRCAMYRRKEYSILGYIASWGALPLGFSLLTVGLQFMNNI